MTPGPLQASGRNAPRARRIDVPPFLRDVRVLQAIGQVAFVLIVMVVFSLLANTVTTELRAKNLVPGFGFLSQRAGFDISDSPDWYSGDSSYGDAFLVGMINTLRVVSVGLVLATVLGVFFGIFLLSSNWLIRSISRGYVELLRNTPLLVQIFVWYFIVMFSLPKISEALTFPAEGVTFFSLRILIWAVLWFVVQRSTDGMAQDVQRARLRSGFIALLAFSELAFWLHHNAGGWPGLRAGAGGVSASFLLWALFSLLLLAGARRLQQPRRRAQALGLAGGQALAGLLFAGGIMPDAALRVELSPSIYISNRGFVFPQLLPTARFAEWLAFLGLGLLAAIFIWMWFGRLTENTGRPWPRGTWAVGALLGMALLGWMIIGAEPVPQTVAIEQGDTLVLMPLEEAREEALLSLDQRLQTSAQPLLVQMPAQNRFGRFLAGTEFLPEYMAILLALVVYTSAFIAEIVRAGIQAVDRGQIEAARAIGLTRAQTLSLVILPQALRVIIPPMGNQYLNLSKNSSLAQGIAYTDTFAASYTIMNQSGQTITGFTIVMVYYLTLSLLISAGMNLLNRRFRLVTR